MRAATTIRLVLLLCISAAPTRVARAQEPQEAPAPPRAVLPHPDARWWLSGQINLIGQTHGTFRSPYEGEHSFRAASDHALSRIWTIYTGWRLSDRTEMLFDVESAGGRGLGGALGLAGFTDLDVVRSPDLGAAPYIARVMVRHVIALSGDTVETTPGPLALGRRQPSRRLEIRAGKISMVDFFDLNGAGSDSHLQFTNWTVDNNGAYDYAADTRGYTVGVVVELITPRWTVRGAEALMPKVANGLDLEWDVARSRGENVELEAHLSSRLVLRTLAYLNHARMGSYAEAIDAFRAGRDPRPDIETHRKPGRTKVGVGENVEYAVTDRARLFGRVGWNDGRNESFAYTEADDTGEIGADLAGAAWRRPADRIGIAVTSNGLASAHRTYLALGGLGFLLGDGTLRYAHETIVESYYTARLAPGLYASIGGQWIANPGYNRDRGPVVVGTARVHVDF